MNEKSKSYTIRYSLGDGPESGKWIATIAEISHYRCVADSPDEALLAASDYAGTLIMFGPEPHPLQIQHHKEPTLENWLACRTAGFEPELPEHGGPKWSDAAMEVLCDCGVAEEDFDGILDADAGSISRVCLHLLQSINRADKLKREGETHLAGRGLIIPFEIVDWLICCMLDGLEWNQIEEVPYDLKALILFRLVPGELRLDEVRRLKENRYRAAKTGARLLAMGRPASYRAVAAELDIQPSTVKRWFKSPAEFQALAAPLTGLYTSEGVRKESPPLRVNKLAQRLRKCP